MRFRLALLRPFVRSRRLRLAALPCAALLSACQLLPQRSSAPPAQPIPQVRPDPFANAVSEQLEMMGRLSMGSPAEQAEVLQAARFAADNAPTTTHRLRYALALSVPNHGGANPQLARQMLATLLATPETLLAAERTLAQITLKNVEQRLVLQAEIDKLQQDATRLDRERLAASATNKRAQTLTEENEKLRKQLADAQAKLDEITRIERAIIDRNPGNKTKK